ncbi:MAG: hypothetical protein M0R17_02545 [Candidatus Omnitrophica bacterium]|jgi:hypothetical protein|nr:hypothetical protein [Candidatus Omnitrophota bacterium]
MSNNFYISLGSLSGINLYFDSLNKGDSNLYFKVYSNEIQIPPQTKIKAIIVPSGISNLPDPDTAFSVSELLVRLRSDKIYSDDDYGLYSVYGGSNNTSSNINPSFNDVKIGTMWENSVFDIHWIIQRNNVETYGSYSGVWSLPHNIQNQEVIISGQLISDDTMHYTLNWSGISNEGSLLYNYPTYGPYRMYVSHAYDVNDTVSGFTNYVYYPSGTFISGVSFNLPYNDPRTNTPAIYLFNLLNVSAYSGIRFNSSPKIITVDHAQLNSTSYFKNLDNEVFSSPDVNKLKKVDEVLIESNVINRKRLSIGINDICIKNNIYMKQGVYVSNYYPVDFNIYTFSLKVDEFIPDYENINKYNIVKYFIEFNSKYEQISPISRSDEFLDNKLIPKLLIFDKGQDINHIKYLNYENVRSFRIKILFDLSFLTDNKFISPEIFDYKCILYSKEQFLSL